MEVVLAIIAIALIILFIVYVVLPAISIIAAITLSISAVYALVVSLISFFSSLKENINPYATYVDQNDNAPEGVKRNYCFGPGFYQIKKVVKGAFDNLGDYRDKLSCWKNNTLKGNWAIDIWIYIGYCFAVFCSMVLGTIWVSAFSVLLTAVIVVGMVGFFAFFTALLLADCAVLLIKSIHNRCPSCKRKSFIPVFLCQTCGTPHKKLIPGPYGVLKRKCICGNELATTFIGGRNKYEAHCPYCDSILYSSVSKQYGIQLVGGIGTGKTTFLSAFWHEYKEYLDQRNNVSYNVVPPEAFQMLEKWFDSGNSESTLETNATMYSIIHSLSPKKSIQMTIYDIAGEVFEYARSEIQQQQYKYCEGFIFVVDPTADPGIISATASSFVNSFSELRGSHSSKISNVPVAVIITKADLFKKEIGVPIIRATYNKSAGADQTQYSYDQHQNNVCKDYLFKHGYGSTVNMIESTFTNFRYFPVSAMGHESEQGKYEPWGVLAPVFWLAGKDKSVLHDIIGGSNE